MKIELEKEVVLEEVGEIRFGPPLYDLILKGKRLESRSFLPYYCLSDDLRYVVLTEYLVESKTGSYWTQLVLIDRLNDQLATYGRIKQGLIKPLKIEGEKVVFTREAQVGLIREYELEISVIKHKSKDIS
jgi:hypothetical protein